MFLNVLTKILKMLVYTHTDNYNLENLKIHQKT